MTQKKNKSKMQCALKSSPRKDIKAPFSFFCKSLTMQLVTIPTNEAIQGAKTIQNSYID